MAAPPLVLDESGARALPLSIVAAAPGPIVCALFNADGRPYGAVGGRIIDAPVSRVWKLVADLDLMPRRIPLVHSVAIDGDRATIQLRLKVAVLTFKFGFTARLTSEPERFIRFQYLSGDPRDLDLRFDVAPAQGDRSIVHAGIVFDPDSLGWLASYFLRHHPEIRHGVHPGSVLTILDAIRAAASTRG